MLQRKRVSPEQALQKAKHFCAYQERSHSEVKEKLYSLGLYKKEVEELLSRLIEEDYLNEERFAKAFAGGKFRMKNWGRIKIGYELRQRNVSEYNVRKAMKEIDEQSYLETFQKLFGTKLDTLRSEKNVIIRKRKIMDYLMQKGYEREMIFNKLKEL